MWPLRFKVAMIARKFGHCAATVITPSRKHGTAERLFMYIMQSARQL